MKLKMSLAATLLLTLGAALAMNTLTSCTLFGGKAECFVKEKLATGFTNVVVDRGICPATGKLVIQKRNEEFLEAVGICKQETGAIGDAVCPIAVFTVVEKVFSGGLEAAYPNAGCTGGATKDVLSAWLTAKCKELVPVSKVQ